MLELAASLLLSYGLHSSLLLGSVWALERWLQRRGLAESAWRAALLGAWASSLLAVVLALRPPPDLPAVPLAEPVVAALPAVAAPAPVLPAPALPATGSDWLSPLLAALTLLWLLGAGLGLLRLALQALRLSWHSRRLPPWPHADLQAPPGVRLQLTAAPSPWAWGRRVGLPAWLQQETDPRLREAVLAHELAHLQRRDPAWRLLTRAAACLGWLQPLNRLALRRLDVLMEADCDRRAAQRTGQPQALAEGLLRCAEQLRAGPVRLPRLALAMHDTTPLLARLRLLLEPSPMRFTPLPHARWWITGALLLAALALPAALLPEGRLAAVFGETMDSLDFAGPSWLHTQGGNSTLVRTGAPGLTQELRWKGRLQLNEDETGVLAVGGPLQFRERRDGQRREWTLTENLRAEYRVNGELREVDAEGSAWISAMLKMAAEATQPPAQRVAQVLQREGLDGLQRYLAEANQDHQRRQRISAAAALPAVPVEALLQASDGVTGSFERRHTLEALLPRLSGEAAWRSWLSLAAAVDSDFELAQLLAHAAARLQPALQTEWVRAVGSIANDFEQRRALEAVLQRADAADWALSALLAAEHLGGGHEQMLLQQQLAKALPQPVPLSLGLPLAEASQRLSSDFERRQALDALLQRQPREPEILRAVLRAGSGIANSYERLRLLQALAPLLPADASLHADYRALARGLSAHERGLAEQALDR